MPRDTELVETHLHLVRKLSAVYARRLSGNYEEFYSAGLVGLLQAARRFDPSRHDDFSVYARERIRGAILDYFRANDILTRDQRRARIEHPELAYRFHTTQVPFQTLASKAEKRANFLPALLHRDAVRTLMVALSPRLQDIVTMYYFDQKTLKEIGVVEGFTESRACQLLGIALKTMADYAKRHGITLED